MADLNQMMKRMKKGVPVEVYSRMIVDCARRYKEGGGGPLCCFYVCRASEIPEELKVEGFRESYDSGDPLVIGCSRGCLPVRGVKRNLVSYRKKLCSECVKEAQEVLETCR